MSALAWDPADLRYAGDAAPRHPHLVVLPGGGRGSSLAGPARITRRGRLALVGLVLVLAAAFGFVGLRGAGAVHAPHIVTVGAGQTLSEVAATELPDLSVSSAIVAIQIENRLNTAQVSAGQQLVIPQG